MGGLCKPEDWRDAFRRDTVRFGCEGNPNIRSIPRAVPLLKRRDEEVYRGHGLMTEFECRDVAAKLAVVVPIPVVDKLPPERQNPAEVIWLGQLLPISIAPVYLSEPLKVHEKEVRARPTLEQVVTSLSHRTPDLHSL